MTKSSKVILLLLLLAISIIVSLYYWTQEPSLPRDKNSINAKQKIVPTLNRKYLDSALVFVRAFEVPINVLDLQSKNGIVYCAGLNSIYAYDSLGNLLNTYGRAGKAPGELLTMVSFVLDKTKISVFDMGTIRATDFAYSGKVLKTFDFSSAFSRGVWAGQDQYLAVVRNGGTQDSEEFELFNIQTNQGRKLFIPRLTKSSHTLNFARAMELDGKLFNPGYGTIFRVSSFAAEFIAFDTLGNVKYHKTTIDESPFPVVIIRGTGEDVSATYDPEKSRLINTGATADEKRLYISSNAKTPEITSSSTGLNTIIVIDIYNAQNGDYIASLRVPPYEKSTPGSYPPLIAISPPNGLCVFEGISVRYYSLKLPKEML